MPTKFDSDMLHLKKRLLAMSTIAEEMIAGTISMLVDRDETRIEKIRAAEEQMDGFQKEIDDETVRLIAVYTPVAADLRLLLMSTRINAELERIGDQTINICKRCAWLFKDQPLKPLLDIPRMAELAQKMLGDALNAFVEGDSDKAIEVVRRDDEVDNLNDQVVRELITYMLDDKEGISRALNLILISKSLERIADHAVNIAEDVVYVVRGEDIRHEDIS